MLRKESLGAWIVEEPEAGPYAFYPTTISTGNTQNIGYGKNYPNSYLRPSKFFGTNISEIECVLNDTIDCVLRFKFDYPNARLLMGYYIFKIPELGVESTFNYQYETVYFTSSLSSNTEYTLVLERRNVNSQIVWNLSEENGVQTLDIQLKALTIDPINDIANIKFVKTDTALDLTIQFDQDGFETLLLLNNQQLDDNVNVPNLNIFVMILYIFWGNINGIGNGIQITDADFSMPLFMLYENAVLNNPLNIKNSGVLFDASEMQDFFVRINENSTNGTYREFLENSVLTLRDEDPDNLRVWQVLIDEFRRFETVFNSNAFYFVGEIV